MVDHHVDRPEVEAGQPAQLTGTNRSIGLTRRIQRQKSMRDPASKASGWSNNAPAKAGAHQTRYQASGIRKGRQPSSPRHQSQLASGRFPGSRPGTLRPWAPAFAGVLARPTPRGARRVSRQFGRPGGHSEGQNTRSHPELGRENPQRRWYCASRRGRVGRRQSRQTAQSHITSVSILLTRGGAAR